jgi:hypothetical protein
MMTMITMITDVPEDPNYVGDLLEVPWPELSRPELHNLWHSRETNLHGYGNLLQYWTLQMDALSSRNETQLLHP